MGTGHPFGKGLFCFYGEIPIGSSGRSRRRGRIRRRRRRRRREEIFAVKVSTRRTFKLLQTELTGVGICCSHVPKEVMDGLLSCCKIQPYTSYIICYLLSLTPLLCASRSRPSSPPSPSPSLLGQSRRRHAPRSRPLCVLALTSRIWMQRFQ